MLTFQQMSKLWIIPILLAAGLSATAESFSFSRINHLAGAFDGLDRKGHVFVTAELGSVGPLPMYAYWSSGNVTNALPAADGWRIPLLESQLLPRSENSYELVQPDGVRRVLWVNAKRPSEIGNGVWKGTCRGSDAALSTDFGSPAENLQLVFRQGRLVRMRIPEGTFDFAYAGRAFEKISSAGRVLLTVAKDPKQPARQLFRFADKRTASLTRNAYRVEIVGADGNRQTFDYGSDGGNDTMKTAAGAFSWNRYTGIVVRANDWSYTVGECKPDWNDPPVSRRHADGRVESHWFNLANGKGLATEADGTRREWAKFPSGDLYGLTRWTETSRDGRRLSRQEFSYDSSRRLVFSRAIAYGETTDTDETWYGPDGAPVRRRRNGKVVTP